MPSPSPSRMISLPEPSEYAPYYGAYIQKVPPGDVLQILEAQLSETLRLMTPLDEQKAEFRYAPGKWSVKEVLGHVSDCERVFAYRALRISRSDPTPLPGFDQDEYVKQSSFGRRGLDEIAAEFALVRKTTLALFRGCTPEMLLRHGVANGVPVSVRAIVYILAGHERHHIDVIRDRYL